MSLVLAIAGLSLFGAVLIACLRRMRNLDQRDLDDAAKYLGEFPTPRSDTEASP